MTPKRKAALQWFHDRGEVRTPIYDVDAPGDTMLARMAKDGQLDEYKSKGRFVMALTDKGRQDLHEATQ